MSETWLGLWGWGPQLLACPAPCSGPPAALSPTGKVYQWEDPDSKLFDPPEDPNPPESAPVSRLTRAEVYKELRLRGYDYGPHFQGIFEASLEGGQEHPGVSMITGGHFSLLGHLLLGGRVDREEVEAPGADEIWSPDPAPLLQANRAGCSGKTTG